MLAPYFDGELDYEEALVCAGRTYVERAERVRDIFEEGADWGSEPVTLAAVLDAGPLVLLAEIEPPDCSQRPIRS